MKIDAAELRRKNFIPTTAFPYQTPVALQYDSGNYPPIIDEAIKIADYKGFEAAPRRGQVARQAARHRLLVLHRGLRPGAVAGDRPARRRRRPVGVGADQVQPDRQRPGHDRLAQPRPGPRDDLRPDHLRQARRADGADRGRPRRHGDDAVRHGHLRLAARWRSAARPSSRRPTRSSPRARRSPPI